MKHFKLHHGELTGVAPGSIPTRSRLDSLSLVSRQSVLGILLVFLTLFSGNVWAAVNGAITSTLAAGDQVVLINTSGTAEFNGVSSNIGQKADYSGTPNGTCILTVEAGKSGSGNFSFKMSDGSYLAYTSTSTSSNNYLHTVSNPSTTAENQQVSWTVTFDNNNAATVRNVYNTNRYLNYNSSSPRFCCYTSGQQNVKFFKLAAKKPDVCQEPAQWPG